MSWIIYRTSYSISNVNNGKFGVWCHFLWLLLLYMHKCPSEASVRCVRCIVMGREDAYGLVKQQSKDGVACFDFNQSYSCLAVKQSVSLIMTSSSTCTVLNCLQLAYFNLIFRFKLQCESVLSSQLISAIKEQQVTSLVPCAFN